MKPQGSHVLVAWIGSADLQGAGLEEGPRKARGPGPIAAALDTRRFDAVILLANWPAATATAYVAWLRARSGAAVEARPVKLSSPTDYASVYGTAREAVEAARAKHGAGTRLVFHLSPGTPTMAVVWILLGKSVYHAGFIQSSPEEGVRDVELPFDLVSDFVPDLLRAREEALAESVRSTGGGGFKDILHRSQGMAAVIERARLAAAYALPVLLQGETGTGKELFAQAIHRTSARAGKELVAINCGAIPDGLVESELFGHRRGAFTGADRDREGVFERAHSATLFLDEVGELSPAVQVRLLRVLQEGKVRRVGDAEERVVDVRIVTATHRDLLADVSAGRFREDLFYRLAVLALKVPPLRERGDDAVLLAEAFLERMNATMPAGSTRKKLARDAREAILRHPWPGNVRELQATLQRTVVWSKGAVIHASDLEDALLGPRRADGDAVLGRPLGGRFDLRAVVAEVSRHYLQRAMKDAAGNKSRAAKLLGLPSYQTLTNWLDRYDVAG